MLEPSNPIPSSNSSLLRSSAGIEKCCHTPGRSVNFRSTILTPASLANCPTSSGVLLDMIRVSTRPQSNGVSFTVRWMLDRVHADDKWHGEKLGGKVE